MALNFSYRPMFRSCLPEDTLVSHMKRVSNGYHVDEKADGCFDYLMDGSDGSGLRGSQESSVHKDILDLLPSDPFGMDISNTFTMITGWLEDLEVDYARYGSGHQTDGVEANRQFLSGFDFIWNNVMSFQAFPGDLGFDPKSKVVGGFDSWCCQQEAGLFPGIRADELAYNDANVSIMEDKMMNGSDANPVDARCQELLESDNLALNEKMEAPHEALTFSLCHLGVRDLLMVELVCKSLHFTVQNDPLLWRSIHIDQPLKEKITDDVIIKLANRAQGNLQCLSLVECPRITDEGLKHIVENNLLLTKDFREYFNFEEGIDYIEEYMEKHGPFHGILGFSQGALIAAAAPGMQFQGAAFTRVPTINFVILISASVLGGYEFGQPKLAANAFSSPVRCPSLHFIGENDFLRDNGIALLQHFVDPVVIRLQHGHTIPRPDEDSLKKMLCFVEKISKIPSSSSSLITSLAHTSGTLDSQGRSSRTTSRSAL